MVSEKTLKIIVIVLGVLLVVGFLVVVGTITVRLGGNETPAPRAAPQGAEIILSELAGRQLKLPAGANVQGVSGNREVLVVHIKTAAGSDRVLVFDRESGEILSDTEIIPQ